jgi:hypothetical protein
MRAAFFTLLRGCRVAGLLAPASALAQDAHGSIVAWGANGYGQCDVPAPNTDFVAVAAGHAHNLGIKVILGNVDCDGDVDVADLAEFLGAYGSCTGEEDYNPDADFDDSGYIDLSDFAELLGHNGQGG